MTDPADMTPEQVKKPKPVSLEPMRLMMEDLNAVLYLASTRDIYAIAAAHVLLRRISTNQCLKLLSDLEREYWATDSLKRPHCDINCTLPGTAYVPK